MVGIILKTFQVPSDGYVSIAENDRETLPFIELEDKGHILRVTGENIYMMELAMRSPSVLRG
jgi:hypothetical protein